MDRDGDARSIGLWASVAGLAVAGMVALAVYLQWGTNFMAWMNYVGFPCFFGLEISALTAGVLEGRVKFRKLGLIVSVIGIILGIAAALRRLSLDFDGIFIAVYVFFPYVVVPVMAVFAGFKAISLKKGRGKGLIPMLILWLLPVGFVAAALLLLPSGFPTVEKVTAEFALLFGPWATLAAKNGVWPNAGEFFYLPVAVGLTVALAATAVFVLRAKNGCIRGLLLILFMALIFSWFCIGYGQLINCHE